jgi:hypothetical protein
MAGPLDSRCAAGPVTGRSDEYHAEVVVAGLDLYGSGLPEYPDKIGINKFSYRDAVIIHNPSIYPVDARG